MKGIILAGGSGSRLRPLTNVISKQLLPVFEKPMVYYPLSTLISANIKDIVLISTPNSIDRFRDLLGYGNDFGINIRYLTQEKPLGLAHSFIISEDLIKNENVCLILGDNIFHGNDNLISKNITQTQGCKLFGYEVSEPSKYGVANIKNNILINIEEKPNKPKTNIAITGLYVYDNTIIEKAKTIKPSKRGELEITDINNLYIQEKSADLITLSQGTAWLDMGTPNGLLQASNYVDTIQSRQGIPIGSPEIAALKNKNISFNEFYKSISRKYKNSDYLLTLEKYGLKISNE